MRPRARSLRCWAAAFAAGLVVLSPAVAQGAEHKFALSVLHFNIQYVAGGMIGFWAIPDPALDLDERRIEDLIVTESFEPVLDLLSVHPGWGADLEMQGYMLDVIASRHPQVLQKLRALASSGQVDVQSFHYGDQFFIAYPPQDWEHSVQLTRQAFEAHGIPLSTSVFCQEGQAGPGMAEPMAAHGYQTLLWPKNLFSFQRGDSPAPLYQLGPVSMVTTDELNVPLGQDTLSTTFWFVDDGELLATNKMNPYLTDAFKKDPKAIAEYEAKLLDLESKGYSITTVSKYVAALKGIAEPQPAPPLLDGTWQPKSTDGTFRWLGGKGMRVAEERDNDVRTLGAVAHREMLAAETISQKAGLDAREALDGAWRLLALGQVSDATGINPFRGEVEYGLAHCAEVLRIAREVINQAKEKLAYSTVAIDTAAGNVSASKAPAPQGELENTPPLTLRIEAADRTPQVRWSRLSPQHWTVSLTFPPGEPTSRKLEVTFPLAGDKVIYTPALTGTAVQLDRSAFVFEHFDLALQDGLLGLGEGWFVIKDQAWVHVGARLFRDSPQVLFHDETSPGDEPTTWRFHVLRAQSPAPLEEAQALARAVNVQPEVWR